jgi:hypothetical protein
VPDIKSSATVKGKLLLDDPKVNYIRDPGKSNAQKPGHPQAITNMVLDMRSRDNHYYHGFNPALLIAVIPQF